MNVLVLLQPSWRTTRAQFSRVEREPRSGDRFVVRAQSHEHIFWQPSTKQTKSSKTCVNVEQDFKTKWGKVPRSPGYATHTIKIPTIYKVINTGWVALNLFMAWKLSAEIIDNQPMKLYPGHVLC